MSQREQAVTSARITPPVETPSVIAGDASGRQSTVAEGTLVSNFREGASRRTPEIASPPHVDPDARGALPRSEGLPQRSDDAIGDILEALKRIEHTQKALQMQVEALQEHSNIVGYLVERIVERTKSRTPAFIARFDAFARKKIVVGLRICGRFLRPLTEPMTTALSVRRAFQTASRTSRRASWSAQEERWRQRLDLLLYASRALDQVGGIFVNRKKQLYSVHQRRPTVVGARPRVMHIIPNVHIGGSTQLIVDLFDHLGHKYEMQVATSSLPANGVHRGMIIHDMREPTSVAAFVDLFKEFAPDVLHVHYWGDTDRPWYEKAFAAARQGGHRIIENVNTPVAPYIDGNVDRYIFVSDYVRRYFGSGSEKEIVVHPGIDLLRFSPPREFDPHGLVSIGMIYRLESDKLNANSIDPLIETVLIRPRTRVFIIGEGSLFDVFLDRVVEAGVRDNFVFTGYVPYSKLPEYCSQFRIFVAPVWQESFGQVAVFAMNMGLAVAGNKVGALPEILDGDDTLGASVEETASKLVSLLDNPSRIIELGERNRTRAQRLFNVETMCRRYSEIYEDVLGHGDIMPGFPPAEIFAAP